MQTFALVLGDAERVTSAALAAFLSNSTGETVTAHRLARILRPFGVQPVTARVGGKLAKAYMREAFDAAAVTPSSSSGGSAPKAAKPAWPAPRSYTDAQVANAIAGAWAHFEAMNDLSRPEAWT